jgi:DNA-directed RNA polymerase specialized sigma24 family protein
MDAVTSPRIAVRSQSELVMAIAQLPAGEKIAIMKIARLYARGTPYDHEDLIHEAFARVLEGRRTWPSHIGATMFFGGVLRSIAWEWRYDRRCEAAPADVASAVGHVADAMLDAEKILAIFEDDPVAQRIVLAMMDGARGEELQAVSGLGKREYESKRTKIRRRIDKFFDDGR